MRKFLSMAVMLGVLMSFTALNALAVTKTSTIRVEGMHCKNCSASVTKALKAQDGVQKVDVSFEKGTAVVEYDDQKVTEQKLREIITNTGYKVIEEKSS